MKKVVGNQLHLHRMQYKKKHLTRYNVIKKHNTGSTCMRVAPAMCKGDVASTNPA
jgi:hypothetical protein